MKYLLDTNIIIDHLRKKKFLTEEILVDGAAISIITLGELLYGAYKSDNPALSLQKLRNSLKILELEVINLSGEIIDEFARMKVALEKIGQRLDDFDLLIASTTKVLNLTLVSRNTSHFKRIEDLTLIKDRIF